MADHGYEMVYKWFIQIGHELVIMAYHGLSWLYIHGLSTCFNMFSHVQGSMALATKGIQLLQRRARRTAHAAQKGRDLWADLLRWKQRENIWKQTKMWTKYMKKIWTNWGNVILFRDWWIFLFVPDLFSFSCWIVRGRTARVWRTFWRPGIVCFDHHKQITAALSTAFLHATWHQRPSEHSYHRKEVSDHWQMIAASQGVISRICSKSAGHLQNLRLRGQKRSTVDVSQQTEDSKHLFTGGGFMVTWGQVELSSHQFEDPYRSVRTLWLHQPWMCSSPTAAISTLLVFISMAFLLHFCFSWRTFLKTSPKKLQKPSHIIFTLLPRNFLSLNSPNTSEYIYSMKHENMILNIQ